jgi:uncharacterized protein YtpQ (UPF0354 family)
MAKRLVQHNEIATQHASPIPSIKDGLSKSQIVALAKNSVDNVLEEGHVFQVAEAIAAMEEFVKQVRKDERFVDMLREELVKHHGRLITNSGARLETCEAGVTYDYSADSTWRMIDEEMKQLNDLRKKREEYLRQLAPGKMAVDPETGEVLEGPLKSSKSTYRITLAR